MNISCEYYAVAFLDIMGQGRLLRENDRLVHDGFDKERADHICNQTAGFIRQFRTLFQTYFTQATKTDDLKAHLSAEQFSMLGEPKESTTLFNSFSDSQIIAIRLKDEGTELPPINGVFAMFWALSGAVVYSLAHGHLIRGGIDVGPATVLSENEVYGNALVRAYDLESSCADYPRILIGDGLLRYIDHIAGGPTDVPRSAVAAVFAERCHTFIDRDHRGDRILDYAGRNLGDVLTQDYTKLLLGKAYDFTCKETQKHQQVDSKKIAHQVRELKQYLDGRVDAWGIASEPGI